jgi:hypothetical protein
MLDADEENTPMLFSLSNLLISFVASNPFITGNWISMRTKWTTGSPFGDGFAPVHGGLPSYLETLHKGFKELEIDDVVFNDQHIDRGTAPSSRPAGSDRWSAFFLSLDIATFACGRGEATR